MRGVIHSVIIWTEDIGRLAPFYRDRLGLELDSEGDEFTVFKVPVPGGAQLALGRHSEVSGKSKEPDRIMVNFHVEDCRAEYEKLKAKGVEFMREPSIDPEDGFMLATFQDPDGNTLQLLESPS